MNRKLYFLMVLLLVTGITGVASADNHVWNGGGTDNEWTNDDNWDTIHPAGGSWKHVHVHYNDNNNTNYTVELTTDVGIIS